MKDQDIAIEKWLVSNKFCPRFTFNTIGLLTRDNKAIVDFYTKAFGFTTDWDGEQPNVEMQLGDMHVEGHYIRTKQVNFHI